MAINYKTIDELDYLHPSLLADSDPFVVHHIVPQRIGYGGLRDKILENALPKLAGNVQRKANGSITMSGIIATAVRTSVGTYSISFSSPIRAEKHIALCSSANVICSIDLAGKTGDTTSLVLQTYHRGDEIIDTYFNLIILKLAN